jgi:hypothetical protein
MPNWCLNEINIYAKDDDEEGQLKQFVKECFEDGKINFEKIIPYPDNAPSRENQPEDIKERMNHPFAKWYNDFGYDWCIENWGTKWGAAQQDNDLSTYPDEATLTFQTAWGPPRGIYDAIIKRYPSLSISWFYKEEGMRVSGWLPE